MSLKYPRYEHLHVLLLEMIWGLFSYVLGLQEIKIGNVKTLNTQSKIILHFFQSLFLFMIDPLYFATRLGHAHLYHFAPHLPQISEIARKGILFIANPKLSTPHLLLVGK